MTYQPPAYEQVTIAQDGHVLTLRPTLRAATYLEQRHTLLGLFEALDNQHFTIISEIILTVSLSRKDAAAFLSGHPGKPLLSFFSAVIGPVRDCLAMFMPAPVQSLGTPQPSTGTGSGKGMPWAEYYADLYDAATGWLGWTPETTWNATPSEIARAVAAHKRRLVATGVLNLKKETEQPHDPEQAYRNVAAGLDPEFDRAGLQALKMKIASGS